MRANKSHIFVTQRLGYRRAHCLRDRWGNGPRAPSCLHIPQSSEYSHIFTLANSACLVLRLLPLLMHHVLFCLAVPELRYSLGQDTYSAPGLSSAACREVRHRRGCRNVHQSILIWRERWTHKSTRGGVTEAGGPDAMISPSVGKAFPPARRRGKIPALRARFAAASRLRV